MKFRDSSNKTKTKSCFDGQRINSVSPRGRFKETRLSIFIRNCSKISHKLINDFTSFIFPWTLMLVLISWTNFIALFLKDSVDRILSMFQFYFPEACFN